MTLKDLLDAAGQLSGDSKRLLTMLNRVLSAPKDAHADVERQRFEYPPLNSMGSAHHQKMEMDLLAKMEPVRRDATGKILFDLDRQVAALGRELPLYVAAQKRNVALTFSDKVLDHLDPAGMVSLAVFRELRRPYIDTRSADALLAIHVDVMGRLDDPTALVDQELIEQRLARPDGIVATEQDLPAARELREQVRELQELRVDVEFTAVADALAAAQKAISRASLLNIVPVNIEQPHDPGRVTAIEAELAEVGA